MPRRSMIKNEHYVNFDALFEAMGSIGGIVDVEDNKHYVEKSLTYAFDLTNEKFNSAADALAMATENIDHMYEWNTMKINRGAGSGKGRSAADDASRLWTTQMIGVGGSRSIMYTFLPSKLPVPKPRTRESGISQEVISKLNDHYFASKASVFESGQTVTVAPTQAQALFIPYSPYALYPKKYFTQKEKERGYAFRRKAYTFSPGRISGQAGQFSLFFTGFWTSHGKDEMERVVTVSMDKDFRPDKKSTAKLVPSKRLNMRSQITNAKKRMSDRALKRANRRRR